MSDNPFLLPPGSAKPPAAPKVPDAAPAADPAHYIAVPASVESATHRIERAETAVVAPVETPVAEETRLAPPEVPRSWALVLPDGTRVSLAGPLLLGRDPAGIPDRPEAGLLTLADTGKTVSKTHALLEPSPEGVRVRDLHSTNGVAVDTAAGRQLVSAGTEALAPLGATIMLGSFPLRVEA